MSTLDQNVQSTTRLNRQYGFVPTPKPVLLCKLLTHRAIRVYEQLLYHAQEKDTCYPSHATLALEMGVSDDTIQRGLRELKDYGFIKWKRRGFNKTNIYTIVELSEVSALKNFLPQKPQNCSNKKPQECGNWKPQSCDSNRIESKENQLESDEALSKCLEKEIVEDVPASSGAEHQAIRSTQVVPQENKQNEKTQSKIADALQGTNPTPLIREVASNPEPPPVAEKPRRRLLATGMTSVAEVMGTKQGVERPKPIQKKEMPRMTVPPLTQEELEKQKRGREALTRKQQQIEDALDTIIPREQRQELNRKLGGSDQAVASSQLRYKPMPVYPQLQQAVEQVSQELGDWKHIQSNITHIDNIRQEAKADLNQMVEAIFDARRTTRVAIQKGKISKRDGNGAVVKMPYFFECLRQRLGLPKAIK